MNSNSTIIGVAAVVAIAFAAAIGAGYVTEEQDGPAEQIGQAVDEAASDVSRAAEDATDSAADSAEDAGSALDEAASDASRAVEDATD